jgi:hypothetical protein
MTEMRGQVSTFNIPLHTTDKKEHPVNEEGFLGYF